MSVTVRGYKCEHIGGGQTIACALACVLVSASNKMLSKKRRKKSLRKECKRDVRDVNKFCDEEGDNWLHLAVVANTDHKTVTAICAFAAHKYGYLGLNGRNNLLQTPLHIASCIGDQRLVEILLDYGADIALVDRNIETAIHLAVKYENQSCLKVLLAKCHESHVLNALNAEGLSALHLCLNCKADNANNMIEMLVESGADINVRDGLSGRTPLLHALINGANESSFKNTLLSLKADITLADYSGLKAIDLMQENDIQ